jgi:hypothetical protein
MEGAVDDAGRIPEGDATQPELGLGDEPTVEGPLAHDSGRERDHGGHGHNRRAPRTPAERRPGVFLKRWAALVTVVVVVIVVLVVVLRGHPPTLYWRGEPITNTSQVLGQAQTGMQSVAADDEGALTSQSRCYFSVATRSAHDVAPYVRCGPVLLPWSSPSDPWLTYDLSGRLTSSGETLSVALAPAPTTTVALARTEVLRRPDGVNPPAGDGGVRVPVVPRQPAGWGGVLAAPPVGLPSAPASDLVGDWGQSYRLVAFGPVTRLSARLDADALKVAINPPGSAWSTGGTGASKGSSRPRATLILPPSGQVFVVAELALSPGEAAGPVPAQANGDGASSIDQPTLEVLGGTTAATFSAPASASAGTGTLSVVAAVPVGSKPVLEITDKGLTQRVSLVNGQLGAGPSILARGVTNEALSVTGSLDGARVHVSDASLVWFAGSDGGTVPPGADDAYLEILASASPPQASFLPASDFTLEVPGESDQTAQALPDADREAIVVGFVVPASFSVGTVVVTAGGRSFSVPVRLD